MKALFYTYTDYGTLFWNEKEEFIFYAHENDLLFREEFIAPVFTHFGIQLSYQEEVPEVLLERLSKLES